MRLPRYNDLGLTIENVDQSVEGRRMLESLITVKGEMELLSRVRASSRVFFREVKASVTISRSPVEKEGKSRSPILFFIQPDAYPQ